MLTLHEWLHRWNVPVQALQELAAMSIHGGGFEGMSESAVQSRVRSEASKKGIYLWRNNVGAGKLADGGRFIRFGLGNDSKQLNSALKSADLVGLRALTISQDMVGRTVAQFVSREIKHGDWKFSGSLEECAQLQWCNLVNSHGGDAKIVTGLGAFD